MIHPRKSFERFCLRNRDKGIPNLMLYISIASAMVFLACMVTGSPLVYFLLCFDRAAILRGQVWRLFTYVFAYAFVPGIPFVAITPLLFFISLVCYYFLGRSIERAWGTCKFNLYYLCGIVLIDIYCMIFGGEASPSHLNLSLFLAFATLYPNAKFLLFYIIPVSAWILALFDLGSMVYDVITLTGPARLFPVIALANYFLFFGKDVRNLIPLSLRSKFGKKKGKVRQTPPAQPIPFTPAQNRPTPPPAKAAYTHQCSVCGRTDVSDPDLEFRYCSRCSGYRCYCEDHINNHTHQ